MVYDRKDQIVAREILIFSKVKEITVEAPVEASEEQVVEEA